MKWMRTTLALFFLFAFTVDELSAQVRSSAMQVVTVGVRRLPTREFPAQNVANVVTRNSLKITIGSDSRIQGAAQFKTPVPVRAVSLKASPLNVSFRDQQPAASAIVFVTFTE